MKPEIEKMARESGLTRAIARRGGAFERRDVPYWFGDEEFLEALVQAVAKRCADLCKPPTTEPGWMDHCHDEQVETAACEGCATAILAEFGIDGARQEKTE